MARMLTAAGLEPAHRVLEIGTGTGYNSALLCRMLGSNQVATVEIDRSVSDKARSALYSQGHYPSVIIGDGEQTAHLPSPDRLISTCTVSRIPTPWVHHTRGRIVTPWAPTPGLPGGVLAVLDTIFSGPSPRARGSHLTTCGDAGRYLRVTTWLTRSIPRPWAHIMTDPGPPLGTLGDIGDTRTASPCPRLAVRSPSTT